MHRDMTCGSAGWVDSSGSEEKPHYRWQGAKTKSQQVPNAGDILPFTISDNTTGTEI